VHAGAPVLTWYVPAAQSLQAASPERMVNFPAAQFSQLEAPLMANLPAAQLEHAVDPAATGPEKRPVAQPSQLVAPEAEE